MKRRLFPSAVAVSIVLLAATLLMWMRGYWVRDDVMREAYGLKGGALYHRGLVVSSGAGQVALATKLYTNADPLEVQRQMPHSGGSASWDWRTWGDTAIPTRGPLITIPHTRYGFGMTMERQRSSRFYGERGFALLVPDWALCVMFMVLPCMALMRRALERRRLARVGLCVGCGYDLRATPDRCPECGRRPTGAVAAAVHTASLLLGAHRLIHVR